MASIFVKRRNPIIETAGQLLLLVSLVAAFMYGGRCYPENLLPYMTVLVKGTAVGSLALFVLLNTRSFNHFLLVLALVASTTGDVFLAFKGAYFLHGLGAFLVGHFFYCVLFFKNRAPMEDVTNLRVRLSAFLWALAAIGCYFLYPHLHDMMVPVFVYTAVLTLMATTALLSSYPVKLTAFGAILFLISDTILGFRHFMTVPYIIDQYGGYAVWITYYLAQLLITLGVMLKDERPTHFGGYRFD